MACVNLQNYVSVAERVNQAQADIRTIHADAPVMLGEAMGYIRVTVMLQDERSATGTASFQLGLDGRSAQATNPIEDCETSAIGRALAFLGFSSVRGIASREEVSEARRRENAPASFQGADTTTPIGQPTSGAAMATDPQRKAIFGIWKSKGYEGDVREWVRETYKCKVDELTKAQASEAIETLKGDEATTSN